MQNNEILADNDVEVERQISDEIKKNNLEICNIQDKLKMYKQQQINPDSILNDYKFNLSIIDDNFKQHN